MNTFDNDTSNLFRELTLPGCEGIAHAYYTIRQTSDPLGNVWHYGKPGAEENYARLAHALGTSPQNMIRPVQTHTSLMRAVDKRAAGRGVCLPDLEPSCDGLVTDAPGLVLCTLEADCVPVYLVDPVCRVIAMIHSGWKGTAQCISANAVSMMARRYDCEPENIVAVIGPHNCAKCYEVGADLRAPFGEFFDEAQVQSFLTPVEGKPGKYLLNMSEAIRIALIQSGLLPEHISDCGICTFESPEVCSWRRDAQPDERMLTCLVLE